MYQPNQAKLPPKKRGRARGGHSLHDVTAAASLGQVRSVLSETPLARYVRERQKNGSVAK